MDFFLILAVVLLIVVFVGHGLWVLAALVFRALRGAMRQGAIEKRPCPRCQNFLDAAGTCRSCGWYPRLPTEGECRVVAARLEEDYLQGKIGEIPYRIAVQALRHAQSATRAAGEEVAPSPEATPTHAPAAAPVSPATPTSPVVSTPIEETDIVVAQVVPTSPQTPAPDQQATHDSQTVSQGEITPPVEPLVPEPMVPVAPAAPVHPLEAPEPPPQPPRVRPALGAMLQAFMEERNIRWGELASGILIVGSAIGLVVSLRETLRALSDQIPYFPALLLMVGIAAFQAAGLYTLKKWRLRSTSRGVLIIGLFLVPLGFAAGLVLSGTGASTVPLTSPWYWAALGIGVLGYGITVTLSARALDPISWLSLTLGVLGPSIGQPFIDRLEWPEATGLHSLLFQGVRFALPMATFLAAILLQLAQIAGRRRLARVTVHRAWLVLSCATFSLAVSAVWLITRSPSHGEALAEISPWLSIALTALGATALLVMQHTEDRTLATIRVTALAIVLLACFGMLVLLVISWPRIDLLLTHALFLGTICLVLVKFVGRPWPVTGAYVGYSIASLLLFLATTSPVDWRAPSGHALARALTMGRSGAWLFGCAVIACAAAFVLVRVRRDGLGRALIGAACALAAIAYPIAVYAGFWGGEDLDCATAVLGLTAVATPVALFFHLQPTLGWMVNGLWLLWWGHVFWMRTDWLGWVTRAGWVVPDRVVGWLLVHALSVSFVFTVVAWVHRRDARQVAWTRAALRPAFLTALLALLWCFFRAPEPLAYYASVLAGATVVLAVGYALVRSTAVYMAADILASLTVAVATAAWVTGDLPTWNSAAWWQERRVWEFVVGAVGVWSLVGLLALGFGQRRPSWRPWVPRPQWQVSPAVSLLATFALVFLAEQAWQEVAQTELGLTGQLFCKNTWNFAPGVPAAFSAGFALLAVAAAVSALRWSRQYYDSAVAVMAVSAAGTAYGVARVSSQPGAFPVLLISLALLTWLWNGVLSWKPARRLWLGPHADRPSSVVSIRGLTFALCGGGVAVGAVFATSRLVGGSGIAVPPWLPPRWQGLYWGIPMGIVGAAGMTAAWSDRRWPPLALGGVCFHFAVSVVMTAWLTVVAPQAATVELWELHLSAAILVGGIVTTIWLAWQNRGWFESDAALAALRIYLSLVAIAAALLAAETSMWHWTYATTLLAVSRTLPLWPAVAGLIAWWFAVWKWSDRSTRSGDVGGVQTRGLSSVWTQTLKAFARFALVTLAALSLTATISLSGFSAVNGLAVAWTAAMLAMVVVSFHHRIQWKLEHTPDHAGRSPRWSLDSEWETIAWMALVGAAGVFGFVTIAGFSWWTAGMVAGWMLAAAALGMAYRRRIYGYGLLLAGLFEGVAIANGWSGLSVVTVSDLLWLPLSGLLLAAMIWCEIELWHQARQEWEWLGLAAFPRPHVLGVAATLAGMMLLAALIIAATIWNWPLAPGTAPRLATWVGVPVMVLSAVASVRFFWDQVTRISLPALLAVGAVAIAAVWEGVLKSGLPFPWGTTSERFVVALWVSLAAYLAGAASGTMALVGRLEQPSGALGERVAGQWQRIRSTWIWLLPAGIAIMAVTAFPLTVFSSDRPTRILAAGIPLAGVLAAWTLSRVGAVVALRTVALVFGVLMMVALGWATMDGPPKAGDEVRYLAQLAIVLLVTGVLYQVGVARLTSSTSVWVPVARRVAMAVFALGALAGVVLVTREANLFLSGRTVPLDVPRLVVLSLAIVATAGALLTAAVFPGRDPLGLSERGRMGYVYAAQVCLALAFAHVYFVKPTWFQTVLQPYWPYGVMGLAFLGIGIGEWARRHGYLVLGEPLQRTGGFLPIVPAVGIWLEAGRTDQALTYFLVGLVYVGFAAMRKSVVSAAAAALFGNLAYWLLLKDFDLTFIDQPQLWLIPPALAVLIAGELNRRRLTEAQFTALRYTCIVLIYLSSSGETFWRLLAPSERTEWLRPILLLTFSLAGVFAGILLQVRSFLFSGLAFLLLAMVAMVWNSARLVQHTWPWWAFGVLMGIGILVLFGIFERHRDRVRELAERLQQWER